MTEKIQCPKCKAQILSTLRFCPKCGEKILFKEFQKESQVDLYKTLQVDPSAEPEVIEAAYKRLARKYHPDVNNSSDAISRMQDINKAYKILSDPSKRLQYDTSRKEKVTEDKKPEKSEQKTTSAQSAEEYRRQREKENLKSHKPPYNQRQEAKEEPTQPKQPKTTGVDLLPIIVVIVVFTILICIATMCSSKSETAPVIPTNIPRSTSRPTSTIVPSTPTFSSPSDVGCIEWMNIDTNLLEEEICVFGKISDITNNQKSITRIEFSTEPNTFFVYSSTSNFIETLINSNLNIGDCFYSIGKLGILEGVLYMDIDKGKDFGSCDSLMELSTIKPPSTTKTPEVISLPTFEDDQKKTLEILRNDTWFLLYDMAVPPYSYEMKQGKTSYKIELNGKTPIYIAFGWCAIDKETLDKNEKNISYSMAINNTPISIDKLHYFVYEIEKGEEPDFPNGLSCFDYGILASNWSDGEYILVIKTTFSIPIFDGYNTYPSGDYIDEFIISNEN
ncbi:MAG: DnaJ domain-containing protein [Anaerolineales bacterium]|nr:DnaJ domain-containing protein [Anaerolineales bacterium]